MKRKISGFQLPRLLRDNGMHALLAGGLILMAGCASVAPPTAQMAVSKAAVAHASDASATEFAPLELQVAKDKLARAEQAMLKEDYVLARQLAEEAEADARLAEAKSKTAQAQIAARASQEASRVLHEEISRKAQ